MNGLGDITKLSRVLVCCALGMALVIFSGCPRDVTPPGNVSNFTATAGDAVVELEWSNPADSDLAGVKLLRKTLSPPTSPSDGNLVFNGLATAFTDSTVMNGTEYFYAAYAYDAAGNHASGVHASATPTSASAVEEILEEIEELSLLIEEDPDGALSEDDKEELQEILTEAELLYRGGDECGAAEVLKLKFLGKAQDIREGDAVQTAEILYNLGRMLRFDMLGTVLVKSDCPGAERVGVEAEADIEEETTQNLTVAALFGEPIFLSVPEEEDGPRQLFTQIQIPGAEDLFGAPGVPSIPVFRRLIAAPRGADVETLLMKAEPEIAEEIYMNLYPVQEEPIDQIDIPPLDRSIFEDLPFVLNDAIYASDAKFPPEPVTVQYLGDARDLEYYLVEIATGQYQPMTNKLTLFKKFEVGIEFSGGTGAFITESMLNPFEANSSLYTEAVLNNSKLNLFIEGVIKPPTTGEEFLILTHPNFIDAAIALRNWKREKGIWTNVVMCGTNSDTNIQTRAQIRSFILNRWSSVFIRPSYILLLGDSQFIEPYYLNNIGTDWPYSILGPIGLDQVPDFAVGRLPARSAAEANVMVNKIISYEKNPPNNANFYSRAAIAAQFQCCREGVLSGSDQRTFIQVSEFARNVMMSAGKTVDRIYMATGTSGGAITPNRYYNGTLLPTALRAGSGFPWNGSTAQVTAAWNQGRFLMMHRDHGWVGGWADPLFNTGHVNALTNGNLLPVVFSVNCASGFFDNETAVVQQPAVASSYGVSASGEYWAERALRNPNGGAVGVIGDTRNSPSWANSTLTMGFFDAIWPNAIWYFGGNTSYRRLGDILNHGKLFLMSRVGFEVMGQVIANSSAVDELYLWHCLGDPTMELWTSNPNLFLLPLKIIYRPISLVQFTKSTFAGGVNIEYEADGSVITIYENLRELRPIGRGVVQNGAATIMFDEQVNTETPLVFIAEAENAVAKVLDAKLGS